MKGKIKIIVIVLILILVSALGVLGMNTVKTYMSGAAGGGEPKGVLAKADADGKGAIVTWTSDKPSMAVVEYGTTPASLLLRAVESSETANHRVALKPLKADTSYYFRIRVGEEIFDNNGIPYSFKTGSAKEKVEELKPSVVPTIANIPTIGSGTACDRKTDYNKDGTVNAFDYIQCVKGGGSETPSSSDSADSCSSRTDYDGNGVINSLDRIKCLQDR